MDISFLIQIINPLVMGICLVVGFVLKTAFDKFPNRFIPLAATISGLILTILIYGKSFNAGLALSGMISGLASTGLYEMLRNLLNFDGKKDEK